MWLTVFLNWETFPLLPLSLLKNLLFILSVGLGNLNNCSPRKNEAIHFVQDIAGFLGIELLYLPSYSPHLNLIERLWRFVRKECLYSKYYEDFADFQKAISECLEKTNKEDKQKLERLMSWNFQSFKKVQISTA